MSTAISAGGMDPQHCEGIVVSTRLAAGAGEIESQRAEGVVVSIAIRAGGITANHTENIVARVTSSA